MSSAESFAPSEDAEPSNRAFPQEVTTPEPTSTNVTYPSYDELTPPHIPERSQARLPTPRPQLFDNLDEARSFIMQSRQASQQGSSDVNNDHVRARVDGGVDGHLTDSSVCNSPTSILSDLQDADIILPPANTPAEGGELSSPVDLGHLVGRFDEEAVPLPLNPSRTLTTSSQQPSQTSGGSVDRIIDQYGYPSSLSNLSNAAPGAQNHAMDEEAALFIGQNRSAVETNARIPMNTHYHRPNPRGSSGRVLGCTPVSPAPNIPLPDLPSAFDETSLLPVRRPNACARNIRAQSTSSSRSLDSLPSIPILRRDDFTGDEHDRARIGSDLGVESDIGSECPSEAPSNVANLAPPPSRMHSTQRQHHRRSTMSHYSNASTAAMSGESDREPFPYAQYEKPRDNRARIFMQASRERVVSANLRHVSNLPRESSATVWSDDDGVESPSSRYYLGHPFPEAASGEIAGGNSVSSGPYWVENLPKLPNPPAPVHEPRSRAVNQPRQQQQPSTDAGSGFYAQNAIRSEWTSGSPDAVKIPVQRRGVQFGGARRNPAEGFGLQREDRMNFSAQAGGAGASNRMTGDSDG